jgi:hypothetical protein
MLVRFWFSRQAYRSFRGHHPSSGIQPMSIEIHISY